MFISITKMLLNLRRVKITRMFDKVEGLNDREEMLDHLRFLIRYENEILEDGVIFSESDYYEELFATIIMIANDFQPYQHFFKYILYEHEIG